MVFIETSVFTRLISDFLTEDEYAGLQSFLLQRPNAGPIIRGTGGVRKLRWRISGKGKSERDSIPAHVLKKIVEEMKDV